MELTFNLLYHTQWGETLHLCGSCTELGGFDIAQSIPMTCIAPGSWSLPITVKEPPALLHYFYLIKRENHVIRKEHDLHILPLLATHSYVINDNWQEIPTQAPLYTSAFSDSFFAPTKETSTIEYGSKTILLRVICPYVKRTEELILIGEGKMLGDWKLEKAIPLSCIAYPIWEIALNASGMKTDLAYKLAIREKQTHAITHWESRYNRILSNTNLKAKRVVVEAGLHYEYNSFEWRGAGVAIPIFSLRSKKSGGIGEFTDLPLLIDWAAKTGQKVIQILPINDTIMSRTWTDSYPYNAISIYALHPIYLGLAHYPLADKQATSVFLSASKELNTLPEIDYEKVLTLKWDYLQSLYKQERAKTVQRADYQSFLETNLSWLFPYACFSYLRDQYQTATFGDWKLFSTYDERKLKAYLTTNPEIQQAIEFHYYVQYLLHTQLLAAKEYAHAHSVILKGDIPIGISRDSVEAWTEPHYFNMDTQTGAPPDAFSIYGQNWGFPTYNWEVMAKDGYQWWVKRFKKMADYFDAYRIDHILGFFRIWEIPLDSVQGLLGYFSPALPYSVEEIRNNGLWFDDYRMSSPFIDESFLGDIFGNHTQAVIETYLSPISWQRYELKPFCNTQIKIKALFEGKDDAQSEQLRNGLYALCNEVLFVRDKREPAKFHPRITAQFTYSFRYLDDAAKAVYNKLYDHFFYHRHDQFWREQAMNKLPTLVSSTSMLVCAEDLGMIPSCVPAVINDLQVLCLEIQRMPKEDGLLFENLNHLPVRSVCTTSTHDMATLRGWWQESREDTQCYYNQMLWLTGAAPETCTPEICSLIVRNHLQSPSMLTILPLQDWLSINGTLRRENPDEERINVPASPNHYWRYRMHLTLEKLLSSDAFNTEIQTLIQDSRR